MGRYSNWTMVHETIPRAVTSNSVSLSVIWAELSKVSIQPQLLIRPNPAALARASDYENVFTSSKMKPQSTRTQDVKCAVGAHWERRFRGQSHFFFCHNEPENCQQSYREALQFHRPSSAQSSHNSELQRRCPRPIYFLWGEDRQEHAQESFISGDITWHKMISHISCVTIFHYCYIEGERWRPTSCYATAHPSINRKKKRGSDLNNWLLPNNTYPIYCSVLLNFLARYLADALLGILTMDSSLP